MTVGLKALTLKCVLNQAADLDRVFHALADPNRRNVMERLSDGPASVSELGKPLSVSLAAVVQHVQVLEASGLIRTNKVGRVRTCRLDIDALDVVAGWVNDRQAGWERRLDRLGDFLTAESDPPPPQTSEL